MTYDVEEMTIDDAKENLSEAIKDFMKAISDLSFSAKACKSHNIPLHEMHDIIMASVPEEDKPAMQMQWPIISMMLSNL